MNSIKNRLISLKSDQNIKKSQKYAKTYKNYNRQNLGNPGLKLSSNSRENKKT